jgi:hypothetical protein
MKVNNDERTGLLGSPTMTTICADCRLQFYKKKTTHKRLLLFCTRNVGNNPSHAPHLKIKTKLISRKCIYCSSVYIKNEILTALVLPSLKTSFWPSFRYSGCFTNLKNNS